jgi:hypothetical protein
MGFDLSLELTVKAHLSGQKVCEVPSVWRDRSKGESRFNLIKWLPIYLKWWIKGLLGPKARVRRQSGH